MNSKTLLLKKHDPRLEEKIKKVLESFESALPPIAILKILEAKIEEKINRRRFYRLLNKLEKWNQIKRVTSKQVDYYKPVKRVKEDG